MKVLILTASVGSGHVRAAQAVEKALKRTRPDVDVELVDVLSLANRAFRKVYGDGYLGLAGVAPELVGYLYDKTDRPTCLPLAETVRTVAQRLSLSGFARMLGSKLPDVVLHTHFLPAELMAQLRRRGHTAVRHAVVVTDFHAHRLWSQLPCERFFVADASTASSLTSRGVPAASIEATGIPVDPAFSAPPERPRAKGERPMILQVAGGSGIGPIERIFDSLLAIRKPVSLVVVTGRNEEVRRRLISKLKPTRHSVAVLGFTDKMRELMAQADLIVSKSGGLTVSEALAAGLPFAAVSPIPGQETRNSDYLESRGAGIRIPGAAATGTRVGALLEEPRKLAAMRGRALRLGRPRAAFDVAEKVLSLVRPSLEAVL